MIDWCQDFVIFNLFVTPMHMHGRLLYIINDKNMPTTVCNNSGIS